MGTKRRLAGKARRNKIAKLTRLPTLLPDRVSIKHVYETELVLTGVSLAIPDNHLFSGNNLADPDVSGTGFQPYFFDQLANLYTRYRVSGSSIRITGFANTASGGNSLNVMEVYVVPQATSVVSTDINQVRTLPYCRGGLTNAFGRIRLKQYMTPNKINGIKKGVVQFDEDWSALASAGGPSKVWYWGVYARALLTGQVLYLRVRLTYYTQWSDRVTQPIS